MNPHQSTETQINNNANFNEIDWFTITIVFLGIYIFRMVNNIIIIPTAQQPKNPKSPNIYYYYIQSITFIICMDYFYSSVQSAPISHDYAAMSNVININFILWFNLISFLYIYIIISKICARIDQIPYKPINIH
jgi:hypothetical protein